MLKWAGTKEQTNDYINDNILVLNAMVARRMKLNECSEQVALRYVMNQMLMQPLTIETLEDLYVAICDVCERYPEFKAAGSKWWAKNQDALMKQIKKQKEN